MPTQKIYFLSLLLQVIACRLDIPLMLAAINISPRLEADADMTSTLLSCFKNKKVHVALVRDMINGRFLCFELVKVAVKNNILTTSCCCKNVFFSLCIDETCVLDVFPCFS